MEVKPGMKVWRVCMCRMCFREVSRRPFVVARVTKAGTIYARPEDNSIVERFNAPKNDKCHEWLSPHDSPRKFWIWLEPA